MISPAVLKYEGLFKPPDCFYLVISQRLLICAALQSLPLPCNYCPVREFVAAIKSDTVTLIRFPHNIYGAVTHGSIFKRCRGSGSSVSPMIAERKVCLPLSSNSTINTKLQRQKANVFEQTLNLIHIRLHSKVIFVLSVGKNSLPQSIQYNVRRRT